MAIKFIRDIYDDDYSSTQEVYEQREIYNLDSTMQTMAKKNGRIKKLDDETLELYTQIMSAYDQVEWVSLSVRGVYYRVVSLFGLDKTEKTYKRVQNALKNMRLLGILDPSLVIDGTRSRYGVTTYDEITDMLENNISSFRRDMWQGLDYNIELLVEKDAMKDILYPVTSKWGIDILSTRGFNSITAWFSLAERFKRSGKKNVILLLTDYDTAGVTMFKTAINVMEDYFGMVADGRVEIRRIGVSKQQIEEFDLPTRPDKIRGESMQAVELDAFLPVDIQGIVEEAILDYVDEDDLAINEELEEDQKDTFREFMDTFRRVEGV